MEKHLAFISHAHQYSSIAQKICCRLEENGISCWIAPRNISSGDWAGSIMDGLSRADIFIFIVGEYTINSPECLKELTEATRTCYYIIPFKIDNTDLSPKMRYHLAPAHWLDASVPPLEERIEELLQRVLHVSDEDAVYLNPNRLQLVERIEYPKESFLGRDSEIKQIADHFTCEHVLFLQGMGGIGKSEIARRYAELFRSRYSTIIFTRYISGLQELFCGNEILIENLQRSEQETIEAWYQRKMNVFRRIVNERTLLIIDNFDTDNDPYLEDILNCPCHVLITTRNNHSDYPVIHIGHIENIEQVRNIFRKYYDRHVKNWSIIDEILHLISYHTITVELIAKQMRASFIKPEKMLQLLKDSGIHLPLQEGVQMKGTAEKYSSYYHIRQLFRLERLSEDKQHILMYMSLVPPNGIEATLLGQILKLDNYEVINGLIDNSWLVLDKENDVLQLHSIIRDVIVNELKPDPENCRDYVTGLWLLMKDSWWLTEEERNNYYPLLSHFLYLFPEAVKSLYTEYSDFVNICWICGDYEKAKEMGRMFYAFSCREYGDMSEQAALAALYLAGAYLNSGDDSSAEQFYKKSFEHYRASNAPISAKFAQACFKIGRCASERGDFEEAVRHYDEAEKMYLYLIQNGDAYPEQYEDLRIARERMLMLQGKYEEAITLCKSNYDFMMLHYGEENTSSAYVLADLGICYSHIRQYEKAEKNLHCALEIKFRNLGNKSMTTAYTREAIADHTYRKGDLKEAVMLYSVLELDMEQYLGEDNPHVVRIRQKRQDAEQSIRTAQESEE